MTALPAPQPGTEVHLRPADGVFDLEGGGFGHGIGMSQYGAHGAGEAGRTHAQILAFYYPGTTLDTRDTPTIDVGLTVDNDGTTRVAHRTGLTVSSGPGSTPYPLPSDRTQWRARTTAASPTACVLEGKRDGVWAPYWPAGMTRACPVTFAAPAGTVDLFLPDGSIRVYRGALTATFRGTDSLITVNRVSMNDYLRSVVPSEMPSYLHPEALASQAVAARTYAQRGSGGTRWYDTCDTTACQVYRGRGVRRADGSISSFEAATTTAAVLATDRQVLTYRFPDGVTRLALTMFSASNGGQTAPGYADHPYLQPTPDPYDDTSRNARHEWTAAVPVSALESRFGLARFERIQLWRDGVGQWGGRIRTARIEGLDAAGAYRYVDVTGLTLRQAYSWPGNPTGMSSEYFGFLDAPAPAPVRIAGTSRYGTSAEAAAAWPAGIPVAYVASGLDYPDALTAASRSGVYDAPVLLTAADRLPAETAAALQRLNPGRIVVAGGQTTVSDEVIAQLRGLTRSGTVTRVAGGDRYATAAAMAQFYPAGVERVYLASGLDFPDALSAAARAAYEETPLLLTRPDRLVDVTSQQLARLAPGEVVVLGSDLAISDEVAGQAAAHSTSGTFRRLAGTDRYATSAAVAALYPAGSATSYVASGQDFPDALVGAPRAARDGVPLLLTRPTSVPGATRTALTRAAPPSMWVLGGPLVVTDDTLAVLGQYLR